MGLAFNRTEALAYAWLQRNFKLKPEEVEHRPEFPEFKVKGGKVFGAKWLYFGKVVQFWPGEIERLLNNQEKSTLVLFDKSSPNPVKQIPAHIVKEVSSYEGIEFLQLQSRWSEKNGAAGTGVIAIPVTRRGPDSKYWRVEHAPMESLTVWRQGEYEFAGPSMVDGKLKFFLVLRPNMI